MEFPTRKPIEKPKRDPEECEIEIRNTSQGKRIRFKGKCSKEQINILSRENTNNIENIE